MAENNEELIEHEIVVDKYLSATLKIPRVITSLELKALFMKANKLFNISEISTAPTTEHGNRTDSKNYAKYTPEMMEEIKTLYLSGSRGQEIAEKINKKFNTNFSNSQISNKIFNSKEKWGI